MSKILPTSGFKLLDPAKFNLNKYDNDSLRCYILVVELEYPKRLHKLHNDYPLASNKGYLLSDYQLKIADDYSISIGNVKKLVPKLFNKELCASLQKPRSKKQYIV